MKDFVIRPDEGRVAQAGDFGARVVGDTISLPASIAVPMQAQGVVTALDLVSYLEAFPTAVSHSLNWPLPEVQKATVRLEATLERECSMDFRELRSQRQRVGFGALSPEELRKHRGH